MGKPSTGQALQLMAALANNTPWDSFAVEDLQRVIDSPKESGAAFAAFLRNGGRMNRGITLTIDRSRKFDPAKFIGKGWAIEEEDERSLALTHVDIASVVLEVSVKCGESYVTGEENLKRLKKANCIRLDAAVFRAFWKNKHLIPESWKGKCIFFDGTVLGDPSGDRCALCLGWCRGGWDWDYSWLGSGRYVSGPSAVLAS